MDSFPWDTVLNIVFFAIGLIMGLAQLWQAQRFYLADQQNKFESINQAVTQIAQRLAVIEGVTNRLIEIDRTLTAIGVSSGSVQERLFGIVEQQFQRGEKTGEVTVHASDQIKEAILKEFGNSELASTDRIFHLETKIDRILSNLNTQVLSLHSTSAIREVSTSPQIENNNALDRSEPLKIGNIELAPDGEQVIVGGITLQLSYYEYQILRMLMEKPNQVAGIDSIIARVYADSPLSPAQKRSHVYTVLYRLRSKVEFVQATIDGTGYILRIA